MKIDFNAEYLREVVNYCPETGVFTRKKKIKRSNVGDLVGTVCAQGYIVISVKNWPYKAHRLVWLYVHGCWPKHCIDHINGDRTDNRLANLRDVPRVVNQHNVTKLGTKNKTGVMGVRFKDGKYESQITLSKKSIYLGRYDNIEDAQSAYLKAKSEVHYGKDYKCL